MTTEMTSGLADDCLKFEKVFDHVPVLSLFETEETRTGGIFGPKTVVRALNDPNKTSLQAELTIS